MIQVVSCHTRITHEQFDVKNYYFQIFFSALCVLTFFKERLLYRSLIVAIYMTLIFLVPIHPKIGQSLYLAVNLTIYIRPLGDQTSEIFELKIVYRHKNIQKMHKTYIETAGTIVTVETNFTPSYVET